MKIRNLKQKLIVGAAIVAGTTLLLSLIAAWNPLNKWQLKMTNRFYDRNESSQDIVIVGIDENSISDKALGRFWDWSRLYYKKVIENLENAGAKVIVLDIFFSSSSEGISNEALLNIIAGNPTLKEYFDQTSAYFPDKIHPEDASLAETFDRYDNIILSERIDRKIGLVTPVIDIFRDKVQTATVDIAPDKDDSFRRVFASVSDSDGNLVPSLSLKVAENYTGETPDSLEEHLDDENRFIINYAAPPFSFPVVSFADVYNGHVDENVFKDKIVLIGIMTDALQDNALTPTSSKILMPGVELQANAIQTILEENYLTEQSLVLQVATIAVLTLVLTTAVMLLGIISGLVATVVLVTGYQLAAEPIFDRGLIINLVYPTLALLLAYLATTLYKYMTESREKAKLRGAFDKYVNKDVVAKIMENPGMLKLGGEKRTISVFFSDIVSFTTVSESIPPDQLVPLLNEYLDVMTGIIMKNGGTLDKFIGDAIMAFWGAPLEQKDHAILACKSALECRRALSDLHRKWQLEGKPLLNFRVGLSTGEAIVGNMGSTERFDYTAIGDIVNLGSRLEAANKEYGTHAMMSDATFALAQEAFEVRRLDRLRVKGKEHPVDVYELLTEKGQLDEAQRKVVDNYHQAIEYYRNAKFEEAEKRFKELLTLAPNDGPTKTYLERCAMYIANPPAEGWDGTWTLDHK